MNPLETTLQQLTLSKAEITIYLLLLKHSGLRIVDIVERTSFHRPRVMELLCELEERELVIPKKVGKRFVYYAASPHVLVEQAKHTLSDIKHLLPELLAFQNARHQSEQVTMFYGEEGLAACFLDVVTSLGKEEMFYQISSAKDQDFVDSIVPEEYRPIRDTKKLERKAITTRYVGSHKKPRLERTMRFIDETDEVFEHNVIQFIYGDKIALLDFSSLSATVIKNPAIADFQKSIFLTLYKRLKE